MKVTQWFKGDEKPVHIGAYQRAQANKRIIGYSYWNGKEWGVLSTTPYEAWRLSKVASVLQELQWRGKAK